MFRLKVFSAICLGALSTGVALGSSTATSNMSASASVTNNCTISAGALAFGAYDPVSANKTGDQPGTATLAVDCTNGASAVITLGQGANADTGSTDAAPLRRLKAGSDYLSYTLWQDSGRTTTPWGNTAGTGEEYAGVGTSENVSVYAAISGAQTSVHAGSFADTVVATITF